MLSWLERAGGQRDVVTRSVSYGQGSRSNSASQARQATFDTRDLRGLPPRHAWLVYANQEPVQTHLAPWWETEERPAIQLAWERARRWVPDELMPLPAPERHDTWAPFKRLFAHRRHFVANDR